MSLFTRQGRTLLLAAVVIIGTQTARAQQQYWTGDGGKGIRLAVLEPAGKGLLADEQWMLSLVQGSITGDFNKFSAMTIIDRQNIEKIFAEWKESMSDHYSDADRVKIGNLTNASHILTGSISKTANAFMLELTVTDVASGVRKASYSPTPISTLALENLSAIKTASADLLKQLGVNLTSTAQSELTRAANTDRLQAETMLARGIAAQRQGTEVAALSYFFQAAAFDSSLFEASKRSSVMAANISSGNIGADVRNDIVWRKSWVARLTETEVTFNSIINSVDPPYTLFYSTGIQTKNINYQKETADLSIAITLNAKVSWFNAMNQALHAADAVLEGLNTTKKKNDWGLSNWPWSGVSNTNPFASSKGYNIAVAFELVNEQGRAIGSQTVRLNPIFRITNNNNRLAIAFTPSTNSTVNFNGVKADDISDNLTIRIASVNGEPPQNARFTITATSAMDSRNGKVYNTVKIGNKTWMAENLNYNIGSSWCYDNNESRCDKYGRLYDWNTAMKACPVGWHLSTREEWNNMIDIVGGEKLAGRKLKSKLPNWTGTDEYGFSALPGGSRDIDGKFKFFGVSGNYGSWWTAKDFGGDNAYCRHMYGNGDDAGENYHNKGIGYSVRCVQNN